LARGLVQGGAGDLKFAVEGGDVVGVDRGGKEVFACGESGID
jgi:hypothetical protein